MLIKLDKIEHHKQFRRLMSIELTCLAETRSFFDLSMCYVFVLKRRKTK